jgi:hypothetical protein
MQCSEGYKKRRLSQKPRSINHKGHKVTIAIGITQSSQRTPYQCFIFVTFAPVLPAEATAKAGFAFFVVKMGF